MEFPDAFKPTKSYSYRVAFFTKHKKRTLYSFYVMFALRRLGCTVKHFNVPKYKRWLGRTGADKYSRWAVDRFKPDLVIVFSSDILNESLEYFATKYKTALLLDDFFPVDSPVTEKMKMCDVFFHTQKGQLEDYRKAGVKKPVYVTSGVDPNYHRPGKFHPAFKSDVAFMGKGYFKDRIDLMEAIDKEFDLHVYGRDWAGTKITPARESVAVKDFSRVCTSAKIVLGIDKTVDLELYFSNRTWFVLGCGGFLLTRYVKGLENLFANHKHLVWFTDIEEALDQIRFYLANDDLRKKIAHTGREFTQQVYPNERMAESMLRVIFEDEEPFPMTDPGRSFESGEEALQDFMSHSA